MDTIQLTTDTGETITIQALASYDAADTLTDIPVVECFPAIVWHQASKLERATEWLATRGTVIALAAMLVACLTTMAH